LFVVSQKVLSFQGASPPNPPPGTLPLDPAGGSAPRPPPHSPHKNPGSATGMHSVFIVGNGFQRLHTFFINVTFFLRF